MTDIYSTIDRNIQIAFNQTSRNLSTSLYGDGTMAGFSDRISSFDFNVKHVQNGFIVTHNLDQWVFRTEAEVIKFFIKKFKEQNK